MRRLVEALRRRPAIPVLAAFAALLSFLFPSPARGGDDRWTRFGPSDAPIRSLTASSRGDLFAVAGFSPAEIWQRTSGAAAWRWRGRNLGQTVVRALAVHPKNPDSLWAVAGGVDSVWRSTDGGATWRKVSVQAAPASVVRLTVAPTRTSVVLFAETEAGGRGLDRSVDLGATWTAVAGALGPIAAPPDEPGAVYALDASSLAVVKSTDGGRRFRPTAALPVEAGDALQALHATHGRPAVVLAGFRDAGLFRSVDGGAHWRKLGFAHTALSALASEPASPRTVYAASAVGLYRSDRGGQPGSFRRLAA